MRTNITKAKLGEGNVVFGAIISRYAPDLVELFGAIGYDFVMIDCEHGPMDLDQVEHMVRAAEVFDITPIARIPDQLGPLSYVTWTEVCRALSCPTSTPAKRRTPWPEPPAIIPRGTVE